MRLILLSSLLLCGILLANGEESELEKEVNSLIEPLTMLQKFFAELQHAFLTVHKARSFANGSPNLFVTNKELNSYENVKNICDNADGHVPSPKLENDNKAFANVLKRHEKEAYLVVSASGNFTNWAEGHPNAADGACVKADVHGFWHSTSCEEDLLVVCEFYFML